MQKILGMHNEATLEDMLGLLARASEFSEIAFRQAEKTVSGILTNQPAVRLMPPTTQLLRKINKGDEFRFPVRTNQAFEHQ
jgi:hypothetical protein